jgi:hypothetical protein
MSPTDKYTQSNIKCQSLIKELKAQSSVSPQVGKGWYSVRLEVHIMEALTKVHWISAETLPIVLVVLRKTWGYQKKLTWSFSYDGKDNCRGIKDLLPPDIDERTIQRSIAEAADRKIIVVVKESGKKSTYGFNKHYDTWIYDKKMEGSYRYNQSQSGDTQVAGDTEVTGGIQVTSDTEVTSNIKEGG